MNAYSADFVHGLEALSQSLSQVLAKLDGNAPSNWDDMTGTAIMIPDQGSHARQTPWPATRPPLPDPRLIRRIIRQRQLRSRFFADELFADPVWDMLLDLTAATAEHRRIWEIEKRAQAAAFAAVKPGVPCEEIDAVALHDAAGSAAVARLDDERDGDAESRLRESALLIRAERCDAARDVAILRRRRALDTDGAYRR